MLSDKNKHQCRYGLTVCKCPISSKTIKLKLTQKNIFPKNLVVSSEMCAKFQVFSASIEICKCPISIQTIKCSYKFKSNPQKSSQKILELIHPRRVPSFKYLAQVFADIYKCPISSQTNKKVYPKKLE